MHFNQNEHRLRPSVFYFYSDDGVKFKWCFLLAHMVRRCQHFSDQWKHIRHSRLSSKAFSFLFIFWRWWWKYHNVCYPWKNVRSSHHLFPRIRTSATLSCINATNASIFNKSDLLTTLVHTRRPPRGPSL